MPYPTFDDVRKLVAWAPPLGVVSVYSKYDPNLSAAAQRAALDRDISRVLEAKSDGAARERSALVATLERVAERSPNRDRGPPVGQIGFIEVSDNGGSEYWWSPPLQPETVACACLAERPVLSPLLHLVAYGAPRGIAFLSAGRTRLFEWLPGSLGELDEAELGFRGGESDRENDPLDPAEWGGQAARLGDERCWQEVDVFGGIEEARAFRRGAAAISPIPVEIAEQEDLTDAPVDAELEGRVAKAVRRIAVERDCALVEHALEEARQGNRGTVGQQATLAALNEGQVSHLIADAVHATGACLGPVIAAEKAPLDGRVELEPLVGRALRGGAKVTIVMGEAAKMLEPVKGVAALLRY